MLRLATGPRNAGVVVHAACGKNVAYYWLLELPGVTTLKLG